MDRLKLDDALALLKANSKYIAVYLAADWLLGLALFRSPRPVIQGRKAKAAITHGGEEKEEPERVAFEPPHSLSSDLQVLKSMWFANIKGDSQQQILESFYETQAHLYDSYRFRMLHGRLPMVKAMPAPAGGTWVDMVSSDSLLYPVYHFPHYTLFCCQLLLLLLSLLLSSFLSFMFYIHLYLFVFSFMSTGRRNRSQS